MINQRDAEFQQRVVAATVAHDPKLEIAKQMFEPGIESTSQGNVFYPTSATEFEEMAKMFADQSRLPARVPSR